MTPFASAPPAAKAAALLGRRAPAALAVLAILAAVVALAGLGRLSAGHRSRPRPRLVLVLPRRSRGAAAGWRRAAVERPRWPGWFSARRSPCNRRRPLHGAARWAREAEQRRAGLRATTGIAAGPQGRRAATSCSAGPSTSCSTPRPAPARASGW